MAYATVTIDGEVTELEYEECVEIFSVFRTRKYHKKRNYRPDSNDWLGNEAYETAMDKAEKIFNSLPTTDY